MIKKLLAHPLTRELSLDDPEVTQFRRRIIQEKQFLRMIYIDFYRLIANAIPSGEGMVLELGSGAGFINQLLPEVITSEVCYYPWVSIIMDGQKLPFANQTLRGIVMVDVLHHLPRVEKFFDEATRCIRKGGVIAMIEPWVTSWSRFVYTRLHHEPFLPDAEEWEFPTTGPLSGANGALPWIVFKRDQELFLKKYPGWNIQTILPFMPIRYLISGGVSLRNFMPAKTYSFWKFLEGKLSIWNHHIAMFAQIVLMRI